MALNFQTCHFRGLLVRCSNSQFLTKTHGILSQPSARRRSRAVLLHRQQASWKTFTSHSPSQGQAKSVLAQLLVAPPFSLLLIMLRSGNDCFNLLYISKGESCTCFPPSPLSNSRLPRPSLQLLMTYHRPSRTPENCESGAWEERSVCLPGPLSRQMLMSLASP